MGVWPQLAVISVRATFMKYIFEGLMVVIRGKNAKLVLVKNQKWSDLRFFKTQMTQFTLPHALFEVKPTTDLGFWPEIRVRQVWFFMSYIVHAQHYGL